MAIAVIMPRQGQSVESCIITKWHKKEGDAVKTGELLFTYETDKSTFDEEAKTDGVLLKVLRGEGDDVPCLENVCVIGAPGENTGSFSPAPPAERAAEAKPEEAQISAAAAPEPAAVTTVGAPADGRIKISPRAKNLAEKTGVDFTAAPPTGPEGRIIERDIEELSKNGVIALRKPEPAEAAPAANAAPVTESAYTDEKLTNMRKTISKAMLNSVQTTAQLTHTASFDATEILEFRKKIKPMAEKGEVENVTLNDIVMYAVSRVLKKHKSLNAHLLGDTMRCFTAVNLGMAVDTPRGLMVPVCFNADTKPLSAIASELKKLAADCQKGTISPDLLTGGTFTVSNLGVFGTESFTPILNAPQTGILGVNTLTTRVKIVNGEIKAYQAMTLSLTYDHRAVDGAPAAKFLQEVCRALENWTATVALY